MILTAWFDNRQLYYVQMFVKRLDARFIGKQQIIGNTYMIQIEFKELGNFNTWLNIINQPYFQEIIMKQPQILDTGDFPDTLTDGWDRETIPDLTKENFLFLIEEHNNLVEVVNALTERLCIRLEES